MTHGGRRHGVTLSAAALAAAVAVGTATSGTALAAPNDRPTSVPPAGDSHDHLPDIDLRKASVAPTAAQRSAAAPAGKASRGTGGSTVTFNRFGSVGTVTPEGTAALATGLGSEPVAAARTYLERNATAFGLTAADIASMEHVSTNAVGGSSVVMLRQVIGGVPAGIDGLVVVAVEKGSARYVRLDARAAAGRARLVAPPRRSAPSRPSRRPPPTSAPRRRTSQAAPPPSAARRPAGPPSGPRASSATSRSSRSRCRSPAQVRGRHTRWSSATATTAATRSTSMRRTGASSPASRSSTSTATTRAGRSSPEPRPPTTGSTDTRVEWCWTTATGCTETVANSASPKAWDVDPLTGQSTTTTNGNNAYSGERWRGIGAVNPAPLTPDRNYTFPWTNQWSANKCNPANYTSSARNDIDAATTNLFAMHNRMHDWSYKARVHRDGMELPARQRREGRARQRPGARLQPVRCPVRFAQQRQLRHPARGRERLQQHVPLAAARRLVLRPVRRR